MYTNAWSSNTHKPKLVSMIFAMVRHVLKPINIKTSPNINDANNFSPQISQYIRTSFSQRLCIMGILLTYIQKNYIKIVEIIMI